MEARSPGALTAMLPRGFFPPSSLDICPRAPYLGNRCLGNFARLETRTDPVSNRVILPSLWLRRYLRSHPKATVAQAIDAYLEELALEQEATYRENF